MRSAFIQASAVMANSVFAILLLPYLARMLGPEALGKIDYFVAVSQLLCMVAGVGLPLYGLREIGAVAHDELRLKTLVAELFILNVSMAVLTIAIYIPLALFSPILSEEPVLAFVFGLHIPASVIGMEWAASGLSAFSFLGIRSIATRLLSVVGILALVKRPEHYLVYGIITGALFLANQILTAVWLWSRVRPIFSQLKLTRHLRPLAFSFATVLFTRLYIGLDKIMLGLMATQRALGLYSLSERLIRVAIELLGSLSLVLMPQISRLFRQRSYNVANRIMAYNVSIVLYVCFLAVTLGLLYADPVLVWFLGGDFEDAVPVFRLGLGVLFCVSLARIWGGHLLYAAGMEKRYLLSVLISGILAVGLNLLLIPSMAEQGAMLATLFAEGVGLGLQIVLAGKRSFSVLGQPSVYQALLVVFAFAVIIIIATGLGIIWVSPIGVLLIAMLFVMIVVAIVRQVWQYNHSSSW